MIDVNYSKDQKLKVPKAWGEEIILHNDEKYCGKLLRFRKGGKFSMHFHSLKTETWYVNKGELLLTYINTETANRVNFKIIEGDIIHVEQNTPHQLEAIKESEIFEISTQDFNYDSFRIEKGDSQC